jgi:hypothetical protein
MELQGGNLTVECILRGIDYAMRSKKLKRLRNLYIQLDNVSTNKCSTVIAACVLLVMLGIRKKVKLSYLEVGHTHEDVDALIGTVTGTLRGRIFQTFFT